MQSEREMFFIGTCVRGSDAASAVHVRVQRHGAKLHDISGSSQALFPPLGEIDLDGASGPALRPGDWVSFVIVAQGPQERSKFWVEEHWRLVPVEDLSDTGSVEAMRRLLVEDGRTSGVPGETIFRISEREMVRLEMAQTADGRWRAAPGGELARLSVYLFDPKLLLSIPNGAQNVVLVEPDAPLQQIGTIDWSSDADLVRKIIKSLGRVEETEDKALRQFADALARFADSLERGTGPEAVDVRAALEILRLRNLAALLKERQDLLSDYFEALRNDPEVKSLLELRISTVAQQTVEAERKALVEKLTAELDQEFAQLRTQRETALSKSLEVLNAEMSGAIERRTATRSAELETNLLEREKRGREALESTLGKQRAELDSAAASLQERSTALSKEIELLEQRRRELSASIESLSAQETSALEAFERLRARREADVKKSVEDLSADMTAELERLRAVRAAELEAELAERQRHGVDALEASLGNKRAELESAVSSLEDQRGGLANEIELMERRQRELSVSIADLDSREARALEALELRRAQREADIKKWIEDLSTGMIADLERRIAVRSAEFEATLAERENQGREAMEASLARQRAELRAGLAALEDQRTALQNEIELLERQQGELTESIVDLGSREARELESMEQRRARREADIKKWIEDLSAGMIGDLERRMGVRSAELEAELAERERQGREALEASLQKHRAEHDAAAASLEDRRTMRRSEIAVLEQRERELSASIEDLSAREARALENFERYRVEREADIKKSVLDLSSGTISDLEQRMAARAAELEARLAEREKEGHEALQVSLGAERAELDTAVSSLETRREALAKEIELLEQRERELSASVEDLSSREARSVEIVARLSRQLLEEAPNPGYGSTNPSRT